MSNQEEQNPIKFDGLDDCLIGVADVWGTDGDRPTRLIYSGDMIIQLLMERDDMGVEEALEFIQFNIEGAYVGPQTPIILWEVPDEFLTGEEE
jgi:hypothetical protein